MGPPPVVLLSLPFLLTTKLPPLYEHISHYCCLLPHPPTMTQGNPAHHHGTDGTWQDKWFGPWDKQRWAVPIPRQWTTGRWAGRVCKAAAGDIYTWQKNAAPRHAHIPHAPHWAGATTTPTLALQQEAHCAFLHAHAPCLNRALPPHHHAPPAGLRLLQHAPTPTPLPPRTPHHPLQHDPCTPTHTHLPTSRHQQEEGQATCALYPSTAACCHLTGLARRALPSKAELHALLPARSVHFCARRARRQDAGRDGAATHGSLDWLTELPTFNRAYIAAAARAHAASHGRTACGPPGTGWCCQEFTLQTPTVPNHHPYVAGNIPRHAHLPTTTAHPHARPTSHTGAAYCLPCHLPGCCTRLLHRLNLDTACWQAGPACCQSRTRVYAGQAFRQDMCPASLNMLQQHKTGDWQTSSSSAFLPSTAPPPTTSPSFLF